MEVVIESKILNHKAAHQLSTVNPSTIFAAQRMMRILMTMRNNPNVTMVIGIVSKTKIGFTKPFSNASTNARIIAVTPLSIETPGKKNEAITAASAVTNIFPMKRMVNNLKFIRSPAARKNLQAVNIFLPAPAILLH
jgi:hypothetical protein